MPFSKVRLYSFRNLKEQEVVLSGKEIFLVGENGQGKTNFLESLYCLAYGSSFRRCSDQELIQKGTKSAAISAHMEGEACFEIRIKFDQGKKSIEIDRKQLVHRKELVRVLPTIIFCHEDMTFIKGSPEHRRWFFDQTLSLYDSLYLDTLQRYRHVLKYRNYLLKHKETKILEEFDVQLVKYGCEIMEKRKAIIDRFSSVFSQLFSYVGGLEGLQIRYVPSWKETDRERLLGHLKQKRERELVMGVSLSGPHRDRYLFIFQEMSFSEYASTGQTRLLALILRVAQAKEFTHLSGEKPILLLDDVLLELDPEKRKKFVEVLPEYKQAFYTFLPEEPYERYAKKDTWVYSVKEGLLERIN